MAGSGKMFGLKWLGRKEPFRTLAGMVEESVLLASLEQFLVKGFVVLEAVVYEFAQHFVFTLQVVFK